ncbi:alpha/beta-hydrolase [Mycena rebaudengoi]|nr:alpha/beta-hydrolase [Mycena rebaudengoi]
MSSKKEKLLLPYTSSRDPGRPLVWRTSVMVLTVLILTAFAFFRRERAHTGIVGPALPHAFYYKISQPDVCMGVTNGTISYAGHIGLKSDTDTAPKRSFFWYFEAETDPMTAPIILSLGGGPGTSGMMNAFFGQSPCLATANGFAPNPDRWTEHHNYIALDHPIGAGFSYGSRVNNSRVAAYDVYDFLQKFFVLFPRLEGNKFIISGGSYGGVYVPNIATVIHEQNLLIARGTGQPGAIHIKLEAVVLSNPMSNPLVHFQWQLHYRYTLHQIHNSAVCSKLYSELPACLESIEMALEVPTIENRVAAWEFCTWKLDADTNGTVLEDIRRTCTLDPTNPAGCHPEFQWVGKIFGNPDVKAALGVPHDLNYTALNMEVHAAGDAIQPHYLMYPPLLSAGIRLLHYVGAQDANCGWPGILSFLRLLKTPFQEEFIAALDVPWPTKEIATVRSVGVGAGNMAFILVAEAGHFTVKDQPALAKLIVDR